MPSDRLLWLCAVLLASGCAESNQRGDGATPEVGDASTDSPPMMVDASPCSGAVVPLERRAECGECGGIPARRFGPPPCPRRSIAEFYWCVEPASPEPLDGQCMVVEYGGVDYVFQGGATSFPIGPTRPCRDEELFDEPSCFDAGRRDAGP